MPVPEGEKFRITVALVNPLGERESLPEPPGQPYELRMPLGDPSVPGGIAFGLHLTVFPRNKGTHYVEIYVDGDVVTRIPFTIRKPAA